MISWNVSKNEQALIVRIAIRAQAAAAKHGDNYPLRDAEMDVTAVHANGCPLQLAELAAAEDFEFFHDVFGIRRHINRKTGQLEDCFVPRYAQRVTA